MDFIPKADWQWVYDHNKGNLSVTDRDRSFPLTYQKNMLVLHETQSLDFTVEDVTRYIELFESIPLRHFEESFRSKIVLHLLAFDIFHKPIMPKSWLFKTADEIESDYEYGDMVNLTALDMDEATQYMVLQQQKEFCLCMLFDDLQVFANNKIFNQFQLVKVTVDKLTRSSIL